MIYLGKVVNTDFGSYATVIDDFYVFEIISGLEHSQSNICSLFKLFDKYVRLVDFVIY